MYTARVYWIFWSNDILRAEWTPRGVGEQRRDHQLGSRGAEELNSSCGKRMERKQSTCLPFRRKWHRFLRLCQNKAQTTIWPQTTEWWRNFFFSNKWLIYLKSLRQRQKIEIPKVIIHPFSWVTRRKTILKKHTINDHCVRSEAMAGLRIRVVSANFQSAKLKWRQK